MRRVRELGSWPAGRWFVVAAVAVGLAVLGYELANGDQAYIAFLKGAGATAVLFVLLGLGQRLWEGDKMQSGQLPGGGGAQFEPVDAAEATRAAVDKLNERVTTQSEQLIELQRQLDRRVTDLEDYSFKDRGQEHEDRL